MSSHSVVPKPDNMPNKYALLTEDTEEERKELLPIISSGSS